VIHKRIRLIRLLRFYRISLDYARALRAVPVHDMPGTGAARSHLDPTGRWVAVEERATVDGVEWLRLATGGWSPTSALELASLPQFRGVVIGPSTPDDFGFVVTDVTGRRCRETRFNHIHLQLFKL